MSAPIVPKWVYELCARYGVTIERVRAGKRPLCFCRGNNGPFTMTIHGSYIDNRARLNLEATIRRQATKTATTPSIDNDDESPYIRLR